MAAAAAFLLVLCCFNAHQAEAKTYQQWKTGKVTCSVLNVRTKASVSADLSGTLEKDQLVTLKGELKNGGKKWYIITYGGNRAYICADYVKSAKCSYTLLTPKKYGKSTEQLNVRKSPSTSSEVLTTFEKGHKMKLKGYVKKNGRKWYVITYEGRTSYVAAEYIKKITETEYNGKSVSSVTYGMTTDALNVRKNASTSAALLGCVPKGYVMKIRASVKKNGRLWYKITYEGKTGYVAAEYVKSISKDTYNKYSDDQKGTSTGSEVVAYARKFIGVPYVYGGSSLKTGVDCSGFTMAVYAHFGISLPHYDGDQESYGTAVSYEDARPGDLIFYGGHVAIYAGNGRIIHASSTFKQVIEGDATYRSIKCIRRLI